MNISQALLHIKAVFLNPDTPFTWASGIKSPIYCDNRLILGYPDIRIMVAKELAAQVTFAFPEVELLMGTATAGIAHAALTAHVLGCPMGYVRSSAKGHGRENAIEGPYTVGQKVVVIEDLISTGQSSIRVVKTLEEAGLEVLGVVSIFSYDLQSARHAFESINMPYYALLNYQTLINEALALHYINTDQLKKLTNWNQDPTNEDWINQ